MPKSKEPLGENRQVVNARSRKINLSAIAFERDHFAEGASRRVYRAKVRKGEVAGFPKGSPLVLKVIKSSAYNVGLRISDADIRAQELTSQYAMSFNRIFQPEKPLYVLVGRLFESEKNHYDSRGKNIIKRGESMLLECFIDGKYEKFNSNSGWSSGKGTTPDAFSHWTWVQSGGQHLICDLQGHRGHKGGPRMRHTDSRRYYLLTDPAVLSESRDFGCTDLGEEGIRNWFANHVCNHYCRQLGLDRKRPHSRSADEGDDRCYECVPRTTFVADR